MSAKYRDLGASIKLPSTNPNRTLREARDILRADLETGKATHCPVCAQSAKLYARKFRAPWVKALRALDEYVYLSPREMVAICRARDYPALTYFGLAYRNPSDGMWRISTKGRAFLAGKITLPSHAVSYNCDVVGFDKRKRVHISDIDPEEHFSLDELMSTKPVVTEEVAA